MNVRETRHTQLFSPLLKPTQSTLAVFAVADNLCTKPRVRKLKPYLTYTETHHLCLGQSAEVWPQKRHKEICSGLYYRVLVKRVPKSDFAAVGKVNRKGKAKKRKKYPREELGAIVLTFHRKLIFSLVSHPHWTGCK